MLHAAFLGLGLAIALSGALRAQDPEKTNSAAERAGDIAQLRARAIAFLKANQAQDGSFSAQLGPGVTALTTQALIRSGVPVDDPSVPARLAPTRVRPRSRTLSDRDRDRPRHRLRRA